MRVQTQNRMQTLRQWAYRVLNPEDRETRVSSLINYLIIILILANIVAMSLATEAKLIISYSKYFLVFEWVSVTLFSIEYFLRLWSITESRQYLNRWAYITSPNSLIDLLSVLPFYIGFILGLDLRIFIALRLFRLLKLIRYFSPLAIMATVLKAEARAFISAMVIMLILAFLCATGIYIFEHKIQPNAFGSIPQSLWWSVVTLTTLGYGDVVPMTTGGRIFTGIMTIFSVGIVALPAGMLAARFSEELHKRKGEYQNIADTILSSRSTPLTDQAVLENARIRLCLSKTDVAPMVSNTKPANDTQCPHCGVRL